MKLRILKKAGKLFKLRPIWKKLRREKDILTHLIVYEGLYKYNIAFFKKCSETQNFESKLIVAIVAENPSAYDFAPYPSCLGFFHKKTMYWHETDCSEWKDSLSNTGKNIKAAAFALMLEVKLPKTPHLNKMFSHERDIEYGNIARSDPLIRYLGEWYFDKRKADEGYLQINDRMRKMVKLVHKLNRSNLIEVINPEMWSRVKEAASFRSWLWLLENSYSFSKVTSPFSNTLFLLWSLITRFSYKIVFFFSSNVDTITCEFSLLKFLLVAKLLFSTFFFHSKFYYSNRS